MKDIQYYLIDYLAIDSSMTLPLEQSSASTMDLCSSPLPVCTNSSSTPSKDSINGNIGPPYEYKINWGKK